MKNGLENTFKLSGQKKNKLLHLKKNLLILTVGRLFLLLLHIPHSLFLKEEQRVQM